VVIAEAKLWRQAEAPSTGLSPDLLFSQTSPKLRPISTDGSPAAHQLFVYHAATCKPGWRRVSRSTVWAVGSGFLGSGTTTRS